MIRNIKSVVNANCLSNKIIVEPHAWGEDTALLVGYTTENYFDTILLAEPLWRDTYPYHRALLQSIDGCMGSSSTTAERNPIALISFAHRPTAGHTPENDLEVLQLAASEFSLSYVYLGSSCRYTDPESEGLGEHTIVHLYCLHRGESPPTILETVR